MKKLLLKVKHLQKYILNIISKGEDVIFLKTQMVLSSDKQSVITDKLNLYRLDKFKYSIKRKN